MDIIGLVAPIAIDLLSSFFKGVLAEGAKSLGKELYDVIRKKLNNPDSQKTLANLETTPDNKALQEKIQANLIEAMKRDKEFLSKIQSLSQQIQTINIRYINKAIFSPVNIENFQGNITIIYKQKANEISRHKFNTGWLDDFADDLLSKLRPDELMSPDTAVNLLVILFKHPDPQSVYDEIVDTRPPEDLNTLLVFLPFAHYLILEEEKSAITQSVYEDFLRIRSIIVTPKAIMQQIDSKGNIPMPEESVILEYLKKFDNEFSETFFLHAHPELTLMNSDFSIAIYCFVAFGAGDTKAVRFFMDKRLSLAHFRAKNKMV